MRAKALLCSDMRFQFRYGIYFIYGIFTLLYIGLLFALPEDWRRDAALLMIFTDPAAMGLFFMGAIVLFEKNERVLDSIAVSPASPLEYVLSKLISIGCISTLVAVLIGIPADVMQQPTLFILSLFLCSCLFSSLGLIVACRIETLNQFFIAAIPAEILTIVPAVLWMFLLPINALAFHPGAAMLMLCSGQGSAMLALLSLLFWTALCGWIATKTVAKMLQSVGGVTL